MGGELSCQFKEVGMYFDLPSFAAHQPNDEHGL
jgi:hypothetical protein